MAALISDLMIFMLLLLRIHQSTLYESGTMLRFSLLCAFLYLLIADIDYLFQLDFIPGTHPGAASRLIVSRAVICLGILSDLWRAHNRRLRDKKLNGD